MHYLCTRAHLRLKSGVSAPLFFRFLLYCILFFPRSRTVVQSTPTASPAKNLHHFFTAAPSFVFALGICVAEAVGASLLIGNQAFCLTRLTHHSQGKVFQLVAGEKQFTGLFFLLPLYKIIFCFVKKISKAKTKL